MRRFACGNGRIELLCKAVSSRALAGEGSPSGPGTKHAGLGVFSSELPCGEVWGHTGQFPGYQAFGAATPDGRSGLAMMANATEISEQANEALVHAQQLAGCRTLG